MKNRVAVFPTAASTIKLGPTVTRRKRVRHIINGLSLQLRIKSSVQMRGGADAPASRHRHAASPLTDLWSPFARVGWQIDTYELEAAANTRSTTPSHLEEQNTTLTA